MATSTTSNSSASSGFIYTTTVAYAVVLFMVIMVIYMNRDAIGNMFALTVWLVFPITAFVLGAGINMLGQVTACNKVNAGSAFMGALPLVGFLYGALMLSQTAYARAPVVSLFTEDPSIRNVLAEEELYPYKRGLAVGYYVLFATLFGQVFGSGMSQAC